MMKKKQIKQVVETSRKNPMFFMNEIVGDNLWRKQQEIIKALQKGNVTVASCHGAGKSFTASRIVLHALNTWPGTQVITTAPTDRQVKKILWKEIRSAHKKSKFPLGGKLLKKELQIDDDWFAFGFSTSDSNQFQGMHGERIIVVADEAAGISEEIFNGIDGVLSGHNSRLLMIGNPTSRSGRFYQSHQMSSYSKFNISAFDTPNFTKFNIEFDDIAKDKWQKKIDGELPFPKLVTPKWVRDRYESWGPESALFQAKVLGQFPENEEDTIVPIYLWKQAESSQLETNNNRRIGIDPARFGNDLTALAIKQGPVLTRIETTSNMDTTAVANWAATIIREEFTNWREVEVNVDAIGIGAGVADQMRNNKQMKGVVDLKSSEKANKSDEFKNKRSEMLWNIRKLIKDDAFYPSVKNEQLENQLTAVRYDYDSAGRIRAEPKDKLKERLSESPDLADAVCLAFYKAGNKKPLTWGG